MGMGIMIEVNENPMLICTASRTAGESNASRNVFRVNGLIAYGVHDAARVKGIRIPEKLWVIGYNGITMSGWAPYDLTTVQQPMEHMAETSVDLLMKRIDGAPTSWPQR